jgi:hypothetical protein
MVKQVVLCTIIVFLAGCSKFINVDTATYEPLSISDRNNIAALGSYPPDQSYAAINIIVRGSDLRSALQSESTIFIDLFDCVHDESKFPATAFFSNFPLDESNKQIALRLEDSVSEVALRGYVPTRFYDRLDSPCVQLSGGSYLGHRVTSRVVIVSEP